MYLQYNPDFNIYLCMEKKRKKCIILFSLFICSVANFFQNRHCINSHRRTNIIKVHISYPNHSAIFLIIILHITHYVFTSNSKLICWSQKDWAEMPCPFFLGFSGTFWKNPPSSFLRDWLLHVNSGLLEKVCMCVHVCIFSLLLYR